MTQQKSQRDFALFFEFNSVCTAFCGEMSSKYGYGPNTREIAKKVCNESSGCILSGAYPSIEEYQRDQTAHHYVSALGSLVQMIAKQHDFLAIDYDRTHLIASLPYYREVKEFAEQVEDFKAYFEAYHEFLYDLAHQLKYPDSILSLCNALMEDYNIAITPGRALYYGGLPSDFLQGFEHSFFEMTEDYVKLAHVNIGCIHNGGIDNDEVRGVIYGALENAQTYLELSAYFEKIQLTKHTNITCYHTGEKPPTHRYN